MISALSSLARRRMMSAMSCSVAFDEFSVDGDSRRGEVVDGVLHYLPFAGGDIVLAVEDAEHGSGVDVVGDDVTARDV